MKSAIACLSQSFMTEVASRPTHASENKENPLPVDSHTDIASNCVSEKKDEPLLADTHTDVPSTSESDRNEEPALADTPTEHSDRSMDDSSYAEYVTVDYTTGSNDSTSTLYNVPVRNSFSVLNCLYADAVKQGLNKSQQTQGRTLPRHSSPIRPSTHLQTDAVKIPVVHGRGKYTRMSTIKNTSHVNRTVTGLFITRLHPYAHARTLEQHVKRETGISVRVEKLPTKHSTYSSFYIRCDARVRRILWVPSLWPIGSLIKCFYSDH